MVTTIQKSRIVTFRGVPVSQGGGGGGSGPSFAQSVLDDFTTMRTTGGHNLWDNYGGEGAAATTSVSAAAARFSGSGLRYAMTSGPPYLHFYCNDGSSWAYARAYATSYTEDTFNRLSFWVKHPANLASPSDNSHLVEFGTYTRAISGDTATQNDGGDHFYHYYNPVPGVWTKVIVENHPQHSVGGGSSDPGIQTSPTTSGSTFPYFDSLTRFYWNAVDPAAAYPVNIDFDDFVFYNDTNANEDTANVMSLEASYDTASDLLHIGFCRSTVAGADTTYTARWSTSDMHANGFASGTLLGSSGVDGQGDYVNKKIEGTVAGLESNSGVYIAIQKQGRSDFRQMYLELS